ncbi:MAG: 4Fe-4S dicluster domain-containing protein, partial [Gammaproteobacteria bacterium]
MASLEFETPELFRHIHTPMVSPDAMKAKGPFVAKAEHQQALGFPDELVDNWEQKAVDAIGEMVDQSRALRVFLDSCVKCGACTDKCHYYLGSSDPKNMPVARQDLFRSVYRKYHTPAGKFLSKLGLDWIVGGQEMNKSVLDDWYNYYHQCSECRRCSVYCPYGIDTAEITMAARDIMAKIGLGQKYSNEIIAKVHKIGNNL